MEICCKLFFLVLILLHYYIILTDFIGNETNRTLNYKSVFPASHHYLCTICSFICGITLLMVYYQHYLEKLYLLFLTIRRKKEIQFIERKRKNTVLKLNEKLTLLFSMNAAFKLITYTFLLSIYV